MAVDTASLFALQCCCAVLFGHQARQMPDSKGLWHTWFALDWFIFLYVM